MLIVFNMNAVLELSLGFIVLLSVGSVINPVVGMISSGLAITGFDFYLRCRDPDEGLLLFDLEAGGHVFCVPMWLWMMIAMVMAVLQLLGLIPEPERRPF